jgi:hypothetical protein
MAMPRHTNQGYLLRLWRDRAEAPLRATLITIATPQQRYHFADLDELQSFLIAKAATPNGTQDAPDTPARDYNQCTPDEA